MNVTESIKIARLTDVGLHREHNEDAIASDMSIGLMVLADGMGGYKAGEIASEIAALDVLAEVAEAMQSKRSLTETQDVLADAIMHANDTIFKISKAQPQCAGMGTTLVAGIFNDNHLMVAHVGDSRMYRLRGESLVPLTEDHSLLQEQLNMGLISKEEAKHSDHKNLVTRALGIDPAVELTMKTYEVEVGDTYLLCSDGLSDMVDDDMIHKVLTNRQLTLEKMAGELVKLANHAGGKDNISVILAHVRQEFSAKRTLGARLVKKLIG